jgi:hypothetical protein
MAEVTDATELAPIADVPAEGVALLPSRLRREDIEALVSALLDPAQDIEDEINGLHGLGLDAEGHALTQEGSLVGLLRLDSTQISDVQYRLALQGWIRALRSNGTLVDFDEVLAFVLNGVAYTLTEGDRSVLIEPDAPIAIPDAFAAKILRATRAGGLGAQMKTPRTGGFRLGSSHEDVTVDAAHGLGDTAQTQGGVLCGVVE